MNIFNKKTIKIFLLIFIIILVYSARSIFLNAKNANNNSIENILSWREIVPIQRYWSGRDSHSVVVFKDKILLFGGIEGRKTENTSPVYETMPHKNDVWQSLDGKSWELIEESAPWDGRRSMATAVFKDKLFLFGGWQQKYGESKNDIWYTEDGKNWQMEKSAPWPPREGAGIAVFKDKIWLVGGVDYFSHKNMNDIWYSEDGIKWVQATDSAPWLKRYDHSLSVFQDKLWLIGGMDFGNIIYKDIWVSEDGINWKLVSNELPWPPRHGQTALEYKNLLWVMGGWCELPTPDNKNGGGLNDIWYSEDGIKWKQEKSAPWTGREDLAGIVFNGKIFIMGGMADEEKNWIWKNDIWQAE